MLDRSDGLIVRTVLRSLRGAGRVIDGRGVVSVLRTLLDAGGRVLRTVSGRTVVGRGFSVTACVLSVDGRTGRVTSGRVVGRVTDGAGRVRSGVDWRVAVGRVGTFAEEGRVVSGRDTMRRSPAVVRPLSGWIVVGAAWRTSPAPREGSRISIGPSRATNRRV